MSMQRIREQYGVPARRGARIKFRGEYAYILSADRTSMHLWVEVGTSRATARIKIHPTWQVDYLDGEGLR